MQKIHIKLSSNKIIFRKWAAYVAVHFLFQVALQGQERQDYEWMWSSGPKSGPHLATRMKFVEGKLEEIYKDTTLYDLDGNNALVADANGDLLFYTNGCEILRSDHTLMANGDSINAGPYVKGFRADCAYGYNGWQDIIILDDPDRSTGYYVIHKTRNYTLDPTRIFVEALKYTYVDMGLENGKGRVTEKNIIVHNKTYLTASFLSAIHHTNQKDWWLIQMEEYDNTYYKFLVNEDGVMLRDSQDIGPPTTRNTSSAGFSKFSPDGNQWAWYTIENGLNLFDFDRSTGQLSNQRIKMIPHIVTFSGMEFSPNGRFIYVSVIDSLLQIDLWKEGMPYELIGTYDGYTDPLPAYIHAMSLAPDCKIYITGANSTRSLSVINYPNRKGKACEFGQHQLQLFFDNGISHPNFPRLRVDTEDVCDSLELYTNTIQQNGGKSDFLIYPNPVFDVSIMESAESGTLYILNYTGRLIKAQAIKEGKNYIDLEADSNGIYVVQFINKKGNIATQKIVKNNQ